MKSPCKFLLNFIGVDHRPPPQSITLMVMSSLDANRLLLVLSGFCFTKEVAAEATSRSSKQFSVNSSEMHENCTVNINAL